MSDEDYVVAVKPEKLITCSREEVKTHDNTENCWVIVEDGVYNITKLVT